MERKFTPKEKAVFHRDNKTNKTGFLGVKHNKRSDRYDAFIRVPGRKEKVYCGGGKTAEDAARKYDRKAVEMFGVDAVVNFPESKRELTPM
ncbi:MAG: hypothetical protein HGB02_08700 [Chlorobiaceae bacterium]|nr:hypothetical protein [Chlorobiaceae bacterium]